MGFFRFFLALFVVVQHIGQIQFIGASAVISFFVLSGYLMTYVVHHSYGYSGTGFVAFWTNRILRLYPIYFAVLICTLFVGWYIGWGQMERLNRVMVLPDALGEWAEVLTMMYWTPTPILESPRLSPPTWALAVELVCYFLISLGATRSVRLCLIWLCVGVAFHIWALGWSGAPRIWAYGSIPAAFPMFALGGLIFHYRASLLSVVKTPIAWIATSLIGLVIVAFGRGVIVNDMGLTWLSIPVHYLSVIPAVIGVLGCLAWRVPERLGYINRLAGDLSYPIYLGHFMIAALVAAVFPLSGKTLFVVSLPVLLLFCWGLVALMESPITRLRDRIRPIANDATS